MHYSLPNGKAQACAIGAASFPARTDTPLARGDRDAGLFDMTYSSCVPVFDLGERRGKQSTLPSVRVAGVTPGALSDGEVFPGKARDQQSPHGGPASLLRRTGERGLGCASLLMAHIAGLASCLTHHQFKVSLLSRSSRGKSGGWLTYRSQLPFSFVKVPPT